MLQPHMIKLLPRFFSLSLSPLSLPPVATLKASWRTMWNVIGWCTIGSPQGGIAKCPEPFLGTRLADKGRTWGIGPILFAQRMVQSPSGPCKEMLGFLKKTTFFTWALALWFDKRNLCVWRLVVGSTFFFKRLNIYWRSLAYQACEEQLCSPINQQNGRNKDHGRHFA